MRLVGGSCRPLFVVAALIVSMFGWCTAWAQNENETVGFRPGHVFESGAFGENIDVLNGGMNLNVPIGQEFIVTSRLKYGLVLTYSSKVWDTSDVNGENVDLDHQVVPTNKSPFGLGFNIQLGRIYKDPVYTSQATEATSQNPSHTESWTWVSPDGARHGFFTGSKFTDDFHPSSIDLFSGPIRFGGKATEDLSFGLISGLGSTYAPTFCPAGLGLPTTEQCFRVETPDGLVYTLVKRVTCSNPPDPPSVAYPTARADNQSFCGWYTALIEDRSIGSPDAATGFYPNYVWVTYDQRFNFEHAISKIQDSLGRQIIFHNCEWQAGQNPTGSGDISERCVSGSRDSDAGGTTYSATTRNAVATFAIEEPAFGNDSTQLEPSARGEFNFSYEYSQLTRANPNHQDLLTDPVLKLVRVDYPAYQQPGQTLNDAYSLYFGYQNANDGFCGIATGTSTTDFGEVTCRTLPLRRQAAGASVIVGNPCVSGTNYSHFNYVYNSYQYFAAFLAGGHAGSGHCDQGLWYTGACGSGGPGLFVPMGMTRQVIKKTVTVADGAASNSGTWKYCRSMVFGETNPTKVVVTDPWSNETVYSYLASMTGDASGIQSEDGVAPEWSDGENYQVEVYEGSEASGRKIQTTVQDWDADLALDTPYPTERAKTNVRAMQETIRHDDDGGSQSIVTRNGWNGWGGWITEASSGANIPLAKISRRQYRTSQYTNSGVFLPNLSEVEEVSDGTKVLSRSDIEYDSNGRVSTKIDRATPPPIGAPSDLTQYPGDVKTSYTYSIASGNPIVKQVTAAPGDAGYTIQYRYGPSIGSCRTLASSASEPSDVCGGYLASKAFLNGGSATWKAIDRDRDANTGLILTSRDPSGVATSYTYDALGRIGSVAPQGEQVTNIAYPSLFTTTVTQGTGSDQIYSEYTYDGMGRQVAIAKRSYDPELKGVSCQTTKYDVAGRTIFQADPWFTTATCAPGQPGEKGTSFSFSAENSSAVDPLGRVRLKTDSYGKKTGTDYFGTSSRVTVHDVSGGNGIVFPAITTFYHDVLGRLTYLDSPSGSHCSQSGLACTADAQCAAGETCALTDGGAGAIYTYDALDRLTKVELTDGPVVAQTREFDYDGLGRLKASEYPESGTTTYDSYDALGNATEARDAAGTLFRSTYDFAGRIREQRSTPANGTEALSARYTYDENLGGAGNFLGKLTTIESFDKGTLGLTEHRYYGGIGGRLSMTQHLPANVPPVLTTEYTYDTRGELLSLAYPIETGATRTRLNVQFGYANGYATSVTQLATNVVLGQATYNAAGALETLLTPGGGKTEWVFDDRNRPKHLTIGQVDQNGWNRLDLEVGDYTYDGAGNIEEIGPGVVDPTKPWMHTNRYGYDAAGRLVYAWTQAADGSSVDNYIESFAYDSMGNMVMSQRNTNGSVTETDTFTMEAPNTNRVSSRRTVFSTSPGVNPANVDHIYDPNGNLVQGGRLWWPTNSVSQQNIERYQYDERNRLRYVESVVDPTQGLGIAEIGVYSYDAGGNRIWKETADRQVRTHFIRDSGGQVLSEFRQVYASPGNLGQNTWPTWSKDYVYFAGRLLAMRENIKPAPPVGVKATQVKSGMNRWLVTTYWNENADADRQSYTVYRQRVGTDTSYQVIGTVPAGSGAQESFADSFFFSAGTTVLYRITCTDTAGYESDVSPTISILTGDTTKPSTPVLNGTAGDRRVTLTYSSSDNAGVTGYNIYRGTTVSSQALITTSPVYETQFVDLNLSNGITYYYRVQAVDSSGNLSLLSCQGATCPLTAMPKDYAPPSPPHNVTACDASDSSGTVALSWDPNPDTDNVVSYQVFRSVSPDFSSVTDPIATVSDIEYLDQGLAHGSYYYFVRALDNGTPPNTSVPSVVVSGMARASGTGPAQRLYSNSTDGQVTISWGHAASEPGQYYVYRRVDALKACYIKIGQINPALSLGMYHQFVDAGVENNKAYDYVITSLQADGSESGFSGPTLGIPLAKPGGIFQCQGHEGSGPESTIVAWTPPASSVPYHPISVGNADAQFGYLSGYHVYHYRPDHSSWVPTDCDHDNNSSGFSCDDDGLIRLVVQNSSDPADRYRMQWGLVDDVQPSTYYWRDPYIGISDQDPATMFSPDLSGLDIFNDGHGEHANCVMPKAVYKIFAEGTWLTVESDWPEYFNPLAIQPLDRCTEPLQYFFDPAACSSAPYAVPSVTNVTATSDGAGAIKLAWTKPVVPAGGLPIAGYYVYGIVIRNFALDDGEFRRPLPFVSLSADATGYEVTNLANKFALGYRFRVVSFDTAGHVSASSPGSEVTPAAQPDVEDTQPGVPRALRTVAWTINDLDTGRPKTRKGVKIAWEPATPTWAGIQGFRVYRATGPEGPYCALLQGQPSSGAPLPVINDHQVKVCTTSYAAAGDYTAGGAAQFYWDGSVEQGRTYYYRVTQLELDNGSPATIRETPILESQQVIGQELRYRSSVIAPPQGLIAFAPQSGPDMAGVHLRWCPVPADVQGAMPAVQEYHVYKQRDTSSTGAFRLFAKLKPACVQMDASGNYVSRCVIVSALQGNHENACYSTTGVDQACSAIEPSGTCSGSDCGVVDLTPDCWPAMRSPIVDQDSYNFSYTVTAVGSDPGSESVNSNIDHAWLNYCSDLGSCSAITCSPRRDPDGSAENPVCGGELVKRDVGPAADVDGIAEAFVPTAASSGYEIIGQSADIPSRFLFYHLDHLGSPRVILGMAGDVVEKHHFLPFGQELPQATIASLNTR